jgi:hypothetical protein
MKKYEIRRVPSNWEHPIDDAGRYTQLCDGLSFNGRVKSWEDGLANWNPSYRFYVEGIPYEDHAGERPDIMEHMPNWPAAERTHFMMYDVSASDGVPVSPAFVQPEDLCHWLVENQAKFDAFLRDYDDWMEVATCSEVEDDAWFDELIKMRNEFNTFVMKHREENNSLGTE